MCWTVPVETCQSGAPPHAASFLRQPALPRHATLRHAVPAVRAARARAATRVVEPLHQLAALAGGGAAVQAQVAEAAPAEVVAHHIQGASHGTKQQYLHGAMHM